MRTLNAAQERLMARMKEWRGNPDNRHRYLIVRSTWDYTWAVVHYNAGIPPHKCATHASAIEMACHKARKHNIDELLRLHASMPGDAT